LILRFTTALITDKRTNMIALGTDTAHCSVSFLLDSTPSL
jgi:hypothetical protein